MRIQNPMKQTLPRPLRCAGFLPALALLLFLPLPASAVDRLVVDASSLRGKILCGYQGWFRCPGDGANEGWIHWSGDSRKLAPATVTFEMWPDMTDYPAAERFVATGFTNADGTPACLFSSYHPGTVRRHFEWMRDHGIDGVWLQHFLVDLPGGPVQNRYASRCAVLRNVRTAARETGRAWAITFDISGMPSDRILDTLTREWKKLVDEGVTKDERYLHEAGNPVVQIWGFYHRNTQNAMTATLANQIIDFFKAPGPYHAFLAGGGDWDWRRDPDPEWQKFLRRFDAYSPWNVGNSFRDETGVTHAATGYWAEDKRECEKNGMLWLPVIYPGFSWDNLKKQPAGSSVIARRGGRYLWEQFHVLSQLGADSACVAMFDEVDEGTAVFKVTSTPPVQGRFVTFEGLPGDWYLRLVGEGTRLLRSKAAVPRDIPIQP